MADEVVRHPCYSVTVQYFNNVCKLDSVSVYWAYCDLHIICILLEYAGSVCIAVPFEYVYLIYNNVKWCCTVAEGQTIQLRFFCLVFFVDLLL